MISTKPNISLLGKRRVEEPESFTKLDYILGLVVQAVAGASRRLSLACVGLASFIEVEHAFKKN
jgi:hypothetical protein